MYPDNLSSEETKTTSWQESIAALHRQSPGSQESQQANGEECGSKEALHPVATQGFGAEHYTLACCGAAEARRTWMFLGACMHRAGSSGLLERVREEI